MKTINMHRADSLRRTWSVVALIAVVVLWAIFARDDTRTNFSLVSSSVTPAPAIPLTPNAQGYVRVETKVGPIRCSINTELVACQTAADNWPRRPDGQPFHVASINDKGELHWVVADLGALEGRVTLDYQTYSAQGWTIVADADTTTFTNDCTGHGMSVNDQRVEPF